MPFAMCLDMLFATANPSTEASFSKYWLRAAVPASERDKGAGELERQRALQSSEVGYHLLAKMVGGVSLLSSGLTWGSIAFEPLRCRVTMRTPDATPGISRVHPSGSSAELQGFERHTGIPVRRGLAFEGLLGARMGTPIAIEGPSNQRFNAACLART